MEPSSFSEQEKLFTWVSKSSNLKGVRKPRLPRWNAIMGGTCKVICSNNLRWIKWSSPTAGRERRRRAGCHHHPDRRRSRSCRSSRPWSRWTSSTCPGCDQTLGSSSARDRPWWRTLRRPPSASGWWTTCRGRWKAGWPWRRALSWWPARLEGACTRWGAARLGPVSSWKGKGLLIWNIYETVETYITMAEFFMMRPHGPNCCIGLGALRERVRLQFISLGMVSFEITCSEWNIDMICGCLAVVSHCTPECTSNFSEPILPSKYYFPPVLCTS